MKDFWDHAVIELNDENWIPMAKAVKDLHYDYGEAKEWKKGHIYGHRRRASSIWIIWDASLWVLFQNMNVSMEQMKHKKMM